MSKQQQELFQAETSWFHVFKSMIDSGDAATMGGTTFLVYAVIKSYTNWSTGRSFPSIDLIAEKAGVTVLTVKRCIKQLQEMDYITKEKKGKHNVYALREKVQFFADQGGEKRPAAVATWDYLPSTVSAAMAELRNFKVSGDTTTQIVHIDKAIFNIQIGEHNNQNNLNSPIADPELQKQFIELMQTHIKK